MLAQRLAQQPESVIWALPTPEEVRSAVAAGRRLAEAAVEQAPAGELKELAEVAAALGALVRPLRISEVLARLDGVSKGGAVAQGGRKEINQWLLDISRALEESEARDFLQALDRHLPAPDRTLALRAIQEPLYQAMANLAPDDTGRARALGMLGYALSALGRREEALAATQEAVEIRRELARRQPDAFRPDLANALNTLGEILQSLARQEKAFNAFEEALHMLAPSFIRLPAAFADWMQEIVDNYRRACEALSREPDDELLGPVVAVLQKLAEGEDG